MPAKPVPIPNELLERLAVLDARCDVFMDRRTEWASTGAGGLDVWTSIPQGTRTRRAWYVRITLRERTGGMMDMVHAQAPALADAVREAVGVAESRGWNRPR